MSLYEQKKSPLEAPVFLVKRKPRSCSASDSTSSSSSHRVSVFLVSWGYQLCAGLSLRQEPVARTATEMQRKQQRTALRWHFTLQTGAFTDRARILAGVFAISPVAGKERRTLRRELREPESCVLQRGHVSIAKHFINSGPDSPLWLDCAQCKTRIGEQRWLEATFMLLHSGSSWGLAGPQVGSSRLGLEQRQEIARK